MRIVEGAVGMEVTALLGFASTRQLQFIRAIENDFVTRLEAAAHSDPPSIIHAKISHHANGLIGIFAVAQEVKPVESVCDDA